MLSILQMTLGDTGVFSCGEFKQITAHVTTFQSGPLQHAWLSLPNYLSTETQVVTTADNERKRVRHLSNQWFKYDFNLALIAHLKLKYRGKYSLHKR